MEDDHLRGRLQLILSRALFAFRKQLVALDLFLLPVGKLPCEILKAAVPLLHNPIRPALSICQRHGRQTRDVELLPQLEILPHVFDARAAVGRRIELTPAEAPEPSLLGRLVVIRRSSGG